MSVLIDYIFKLISVINMVFAAAVTIIINIQVFYRYVLNHSLEWPEELAVYIMIWMLFLACIPLAKDKGHITVDTILRLIPIKTASIFKIIAYFITCFYCVFLLYYGVDTILDGFASESLSLGISTNWIKAAIPVSAFGMFFCFLVHGLRSIRYYQMKKYSEIVDTEIDVDSSL